MRDSTKMYVVDYPVAADDDRFVIFCAQEYWSKEEKLKGKYFVVNIDNLYQKNGLLYSAPFDNTNSYEVDPSLNKSVNFMKEYSTQVIYK